MALVDLEDHLVTIAHRAERGALGRAEDHGVRVGQVVDREHHRATVQDETEPAHEGVVLEQLQAIPPAEVVERSLAGGHRLLLMVALVSEHHTENGVASGPTPGAPASAGLPGVS